MKKIILVIAAVALLASPAMAVDWNFYGSARMATFYVSRDYNNADPGSGLDAQPGITFSGGDDDKRVQWELQGNSRFGAKVKAENISGQVEFGIDEANVSSRRIYGTWDFGAGKLKVGKDYTPVTTFLSGQVFAGDDGLLGHGNFYGSRVGQVELQFGGFKIALIDNNGNGVDNLDTGNVNVYVPKIEAAYGMSFDTWNFRVFGGYQWYEIEDAGANDKDLDVTSWAVGGDVQFNFGPAYLKTQGSIGANWSDAGWADSNAPKASFDGDDDTKDVDLWMAMLVGGFKFTDQLTFEAGFGYIDIDPDLNDLSGSSRWDAYAQAVISLAPGVWIIPEVGYTSFDADYGGTDNDAGDQMYVGAKWQIDF